MTGSIPRIHFRQLYDHFDTPVTAIDCGTKCAPHNPGGKPFCCDICHAVPAAYHQEWAYLQRSTRLWHAWRGDECAPQPGAAPGPQPEAPENMLLLACQGPARCQRPFRALSCRQFPFFPYITSDYRFIGLAYEWSFEPVCWVISNLAEVTAAYRAEFVRTFDELFNQWPEELDSYAALSEQMRADFASHRRRIPVLHRNGQDYLVSPGSERLRRVDTHKLSRFGFYRDAQQPGLDQIPVVIE